MLHPRSLRGVIVLFCAIGLVPLAAAAPKKSKKKKPPQEEKKTPAPPEDEKKDTAPVPDEKDKAPIPDEKDKKPVPDEKDKQKEKTPPGPPTTGSNTAGNTTTTTSTAPPAENVPANLRQRRLEQRTQALKEAAWRVKARVGMLKEAVLGGGIGARASIVHANKMGGSFRLVRLIYAMDGAEIFSRKDDSGKLNEQKSIDVLSGPIAPGNHVLTVVMEYRGHGYGVFEYLNKYRFTVRSSHTFTVSEGKHTQITVVGYERGGITTPLEKRPAVDFKVGNIAERPTGAGK